jgi:hypothetical protein
MLVTRTEAAAKCCPFKFTLTMDPDKLCSNVDCMAWKREPEIPTTHEEMGYCGLAGVPSEADRR